MKKLILFLMVLLSAAVFGQEASESGDASKDTERYSGVGFSYILDKPTSVDDLKNSPRFKGSSFKIEPVEGEERIFKAESALKDDYGILFYVDEEGYIYLVQELESFDNVFKVMNDLEKFQEREEMSLLVTLLSGDGGFHSLLKTAVENYLNDESLTICFNGDSTIISYILQKMDNGDFLVAKTYGVNPLKK